MLSFYSAYGLTIASQLALPELPPCAPEPADVTIMLVQPDALPHAPTLANGWQQLAPDVALLDVDEVGRFLVRHGREILIAPAAGVEPRLVRLFLLGAALGVLLHQRGCLVLHASAVAIDGRALVLAGDSGAGKSTLAATLHGWGYTLAADDVVAIQISADERAPAVLPAFPQLKLWPDVLVALGRDPHTLPLIHPELDKRAYRPTSAFVGQSLPLSAIYVLEQADQPSVSALHPSDGFAALLRCLYAVGMLGQPAQTPEHFRQCVQLAAAVPIYRLQRSAELREIERLARLVETQQATHSVDATLSDVQRDQVAL
jgi:hypothetical protein